MKTFYFNSGVKPWVRSPGEGEVLLNGEIQTPFECFNVPDRAIFMFACSDNKLDEANSSNVIVRKIYNSTLCSDYAYFTIWHLNKSF